MKLRTLIEDETFDIFQDGNFVKHTRDDLVHAVENNLTIDLSTDDDWFICIITDVPPISQQKFHQLMELSFQTNNMSCSKGTGVCNYENIFALELFDSSHLKDPGFTQFGRGGRGVDVDIMAFGWKELVTWINEYYQDLVMDTDDFDE